MSIFVDWVGGAMRRNATLRKVGSGPAGWWEIARDLRPTHLFPETHLPLDIVVAALFQPLVNWNA